MYVCAWMDGWAGGRKDAEVSPGASRKSGVGRRGMLYSELDVHAMIYQPFCVAL